MVGELQKQLAVKNHQDHQNHQNHQESSRGSLSPPRKEVTRTRRRELKEEEAEAQLDRLSLEPGELSISEVSSVVGEDESKASDAVVDSAYGEVGSLRNSLASFQAAIEQHLS